MSVVERLSLDTYLHKAAFHPQFNTEEGICVLFRVREMETWLGEGLETPQKFQILYNEGRRYSMGWAWRSHHEESYSSS